MARKRRKKLDPPGPVLLLQLRASKIQAPEPEHRFHPTRQWRFDFAWLDLKLAVEIEGITNHHMKNPDGSIKLGRHQTAKGLTEDCIKYAEADALGWTVLRFTQNQIRGGVALPYIVAAYKKRETRARMISALDASATEKRA